MPPGERRTLANETVVRAVLGDCADGCYFCRRGSCAVVDYFRATGDYFLCLPFERADGRPVFFAPLDDAPTLVQTAVGLTQWKGD